MEDEVEIGRITNEYSTIRVIVARRDGGARLILLSDRTGDALALDATGLEAVASLDHRGVAVMVEAMTEFGTAQAALGISDRLPNDTGWASRPIDPEDAGT